MGTLSLREKSTEQSLLFGLAECAMHGGIFGDGLLAAALNTDACAPA